MQVELVKLQLILILQTSANGTTGWTFVQGSPGAAPGSVTSFVIPEAQEDQYLRASYQVTDSKDLTPAIVQPLVKLLQSKSSKIEESDS